MNPLSQLHQSLRAAAKPLAIAAGLAGALAVSGGALAFTSGSTGADGALAPSVGTVEVQVPESGILNYTTINIPTGVTVKFKRNTLNTPVVVLVSADVTISGLLDIRGEDAKAAGTYGDGNVADDGIPGTGGPGGFAGGRGGRADAAQNPATIVGGTGLGPGGAVGGIAGSDGCSLPRRFKSWGLGASYATAGGDGSTHLCGFTVSEQAQPYGSALLQPLVGGSGGGGGRGGTGFSGSGGGGGGGALLLAASGTITINASGSIDATGGDSGGVSGTGVGANGGGGSGGAIRLIATNIAGAGSLLARGGCTNISNQRRQDCLLSDFSGHGGAPGRIRLEGEFITFSGTVSPTQSVDVPGPVFLSSVPTLRIASVAGTAVPANPTGNADVALPADVANPVTVALETTNVPTGNTVLVKLVPAFGTPTEVLSPALSGSSASGSTSVQLTLPQGPSVLQATTTYTVVVAMGEALSRFAQNERVEKVQLIATLGGQSQAKLITVSGKEYLVPASVLQLVGFTG